MTKKRLQNGTEYRLLTDNITLSWQDWDKLKKHSMDLDTIASCSIDEEDKKVSNKLWKVINKYDFPYGDQKPKIRTYPYKKIQEYLRELDEVFQQHRGTYKKHFKARLENNY